MPKHIKNINCLNQSMQIFKKRSKGLNSIEIQKYYINYDKH